MKVTKTERLGNGNLLVTVPVTFKWRNTGNGRVIINPDSSIVDLRRRQSSPPGAWAALVQLLDDGSVESIRAIAAKIGREPELTWHGSYACRCSPSIIESVIRGDYPADLSVNSTRSAVPDLWKDQVTELMSKTTIGDTINAKGRRTAMPAAFYISFSGGCQRRYRQPSAWTKAESTSSAMSMLGNM